jgi:uncharacterized protein
MADDALPYERLTEAALRNVAREALAIAAKRGLPGDHHFYISFRTDHPGVEIPEQLRQRYPEEMTVVLQHQFFGLDVGADSFSVTLSFDGKQERLTIPFTALAAFVDPSVQFGLKFEGAAALAAEARANGGQAERRLSAVPARPEEPATEPPPKPSGDSSGQVVKLDKFRKK